MKAMPTADGSKPVHFKQTKNGIRGYQAKSISYTKCTEDEFKRVLDQVVEIVETTIGVKINKLKLESEREA
jgi:LPS O-antigen subunit length determinant protein (WzzB/FepE family)